MSKLYFYYGTMGAAKSAEALICKHRYEEIEKSVLVFKSKHASRDGSNYIKSRLGMHAEAIILEDFMNTISTKELKAIIAAHDIIIVDEVQFCNEKTINFLAYLVDTFDIPVLCYGLKTDSNTHLFEGSKRLLEIADAIVEIKNICDCGNKALFNVKISGDDIDGEYKACCRKCLYKYI